MDSIKDKIQLGVAVLLLAGVLIFGYLKVTNFIGLYSYINDLETAIINTDSTIAGLTDASNEAKLLFQETNSSKNDEIAGVFPQDEDLTSLNRAFDEFSTENNYSNSPFFIGSISYKESTSSADGNYRVLPFSMQITSSEDNFYKFLEYIETSGNLDNRVRLMNVTNVSINLQESDDKDTLSYTLELNAYFQQ